MSDDTMVGMVADAYASGFRDGRKHRPSGSDVRVSIRPQAFGDDVNVIRLETPVRAAEAANRTVDMTEAIRAKMIESEQIGKLRAQVQQLVADAKGAGEDRNRLEVEARRCAASAQDANARADAQASELVKARSRITVLDDQLKGLRVTVDDLRRSLAVADEQRTLAFKQIGVAPDLTGTDRPWERYIVELDADGEPPLVVDGLVDGWHRRVTSGGVEVHVAYLPGPNDRRGTGTRYTINLPYGPEDASHGPQD